MPKEEYKEEKIYFEMLGLHYAPIAPNTTYDGILYRNDAVVGYAKKINNVLTAKLYDDDDYKKIKITEITSSSIEGEFETNRKAKNKTIRYKYIPDEELHILEKITDDEKKLKLQFHNEAVTSYIDNNGYFLRTEDYGVYTALDKEGIRDNVTYFMNLAPSLIMNIIRSYGKEYTDYILSLFPNEIKKQKNN